MIKPTRVVPRLASGLAVALLILVVVGPTVFANGLVLEAPEKPSDCSKGTSSAGGTVVNTGHAVSVKVGASITCPEPGGTWWDTGTSTQTWGNANVKNGTPCSNSADESITYSYQGSTFTASYKEPTGQTVYINPSSIPDNPSWFNTKVEMVQSGTIKNGVCVGTGGWRFVGFTTPTRDTITSTTSSFHGNVGFWEANMTDFLNSGSGTVQAMPKNNGLVGLPQCFWIDGLQSAHERTVVLTGSPDAYGREIYYTLIITAQLGKVTWTFGDGSSATEPAPQVCGSGSDVTAHTYKTISWYKPNHVYSGIHASETWSLTASLEWVDSEGFHAETIPLSNPTQTIVTPSITLSVGQVEGVPVQ